MISTLFLYRRFLSLLFSCLTLFSVILAQPSTIPSYTVRLSLSSGIHNGDGQSTEAVSVWRETVRIKNAPWLRLHFGKVNLGHESHVQITSLADGITQKLNAATMAEWYNRSAFFNGGELEIQLFLKPADTNVQISIAEITVGEFANASSGTGALTICGNEDDRTASNDPAVGRIVDVGCTGWIVNNGRHVTAGHCIPSGEATVLEFNVPGSLSDGTIQHPPVEHQYSIDATSIVYHDNGIGDDWAVFDVFDNSTTGIQPIEAQQAAYSILPDDSPIQIRVTGYGVDGPPPDYGANTGNRNSDNQTQQTHVGANVGSSGTILGYTADTQGGNSGSPVIDEATGIALGVHTNGGCTSAGGYNQGTSAFNESFGTTVSAPLVATVTLDQQRQNEDRLAGTTVGQWNSSSFTGHAITSEPATTSSSVGSQEVFRAFQDRVTSPDEKYHVWQRNQVVLFDNVKNHREFSITSNLESFTSIFNYTYASAVLSNDYMGFPGFNPSTDNIDFKDPWLIDYPDPAYGNEKRNQGMEAPFKSRPAPFSPDFNTIYSGGDQYLGVFLNQNPQFEPDLPVYAIRSSTQTHTVNNKTITWDWESWDYDPAEIALQNELSNSTAVVFKTADATITANLKGRRVSDTASATRGSNGAKMDYHRAGAGVEKPLLVYVDRGNIYQAQQDYLGNWQKDSKIAAASGTITHDHPAVAHMHEVSGTPSSSRVIAWDSYDEGSGRYLPQSTLGQLPGLFTGPQHPTHPSTAGYELFTNPGLESISTAVVAFSGGGLLAMGPLDGIRLWFTRDGEVVHLTSVAGDYPAVDNRKFAPTTNPREPYYMLAWQEDGDIRYIEFQREGDAGSQVDTYNASVISSNPALSANALPAIEVAGDHNTGSEERIYAVWQATEHFVPEQAIGKSSDGAGETLGAGCPPLSWDSYPVVCFREKNPGSGGWQNLTLFRTGYTCDRRPVVTSWDNGEDRDVAIAYESDDGEVTWVVRDDGNWQSAQVISEDAAGPALATVANQPHLLYTEKLQSPYRVRHEVNPAQSLESGRLTSHSRRISFRLKEALLGGGRLNIDGTIMIELGDPLLESASGVQPVEPLYRGSNTGAHSAFVFRNISVNEPGARLRIPLRIDGKDLQVSGTESPLNLPVIRLMLREAGGHQELKTIRSFDTGMLGSTDRFRLIDTLDVALDSLHGRQIYLYARSFLREQAPGLQLAEIYDLRQGRQHLAPQPAKSPAQDEVIPREYALHANYPNPFNPSTTIAFDLPEAAQVSLKIYDIRGRLVRELLDAHMEAGQHRVSWDGSSDAGVSVAGGVYLYRYRAGSYSNVRKMILLK